MSGSETVKMIEREAVVTRVVRETADVSTVHLDTGAVEAYLPGQFLSIDPHQFEALGPQIAYLEAQRGRRETRRCYSLASAPGDAGIAITVKLEPYDPAADGLPPLLAGHLVHGVRPGQRVVFTGYSGRYVLAEPTGPEAHLLHLAGGSGIVPNASMMRHDLAHGQGRHTLLYANRRWADVVYRQALDALATAHPGRLRIVHCLSESSQGASGEVREGRLNAQALSDLVPDLCQARVYVCGPAIKPRKRRAARAAGVELAPLFMESMLEALEALGVPRAQVIKESW